MKASTLNVRAVGAVTSTSNRNVVDALPVPDAAIDSCMKFDVWAETGSLTRTCRM